MISNFSESYVAFCDKIEQSLPDDFVTRRLIAHSGRVAGLSAEYSSTQHKKLFGIMKMAAATHCHEFRIAYAVPRLDAETLEDWWEFARELQREIVPADPAHEFSMVSLILVCGEIDKAAAKKMSGKVNELRYAAPLAGWSSMRLAAVDLNAQKIYTNRMGGPLRNLLKPLFR